MVTIDNTIRPTITAHDIAAHDLRKAQIMLGQRTDAIRYATSASDLAWHRATRDFWLIEMSRATRAFLKTL
jgi:hypothetical protein